VIAAVVAAASVAHADSPKLADARRAVEAVDYYTARTLLLEALRDGDNAPAAVAEIYRLLGRAAVVLQRDVVLDESDLAEPYYRRWLAIDPAAAMPANGSPKLLAPFIEAQAYIAAHGRLLARAERAPTGEIDVELISDPLAMARAAASVEPGRRAAPVPFDRDHRARLPAGARAAILDDYGNRLLELDVTEPSPPAVRAPPRDAAPASRPWTRRWLTWAIPTGAFGLVGVGFGVAAIASYSRAHTITAESGEYYLSDAQDNVRRGKLFAWITAGAGAIAIGFAIPTAIYFLDQRRQTGVAVLPTAGDGRVGISVTGRF
jgi:hypothetical protein